MNIRLWGVATLAVPVALLVFGCESKVNEKQPGNYNSNRNVEEESKLQGEFDQKMETLSTQVGSVRQTIGLIQKGMGGQPSLTPFDVVAQANTEVRNQRGQFNSNDLYYRGSIQIDSNLLDPGCEKLTYVVTAPKLVPLSEIKYALKSCYSGGATLPILTVKFKGGVAVFEFDAQNIEKVLPRRILESKFASQCRFGEEGSEGFNCQNVILDDAGKVSWTADIRSKGETVVTIVGVSKKTGAEVGRGVVRITRSGQVIWPEGFKFHYDEETEE